MVILFGFHSCIRSILFSDVVFSTAHKAKGLEFQTVRLTDDHLPGAEVDSVPPRNDLLLGAEVDTVRLTEDLPPEAEAASSKGDLPCMVHLIIRSSLLKIILKYVDNAKGTTKGASPQ